MLARHQPIYLTIASDAEALLYRDAPGTMVKLRTLVEHLCRDLLNRHGIHQPYATSTLADMQHILRRRGFIDERLFALINEVRKLGNNAAHDYEGASGCRWGT